MSSFALLLHKLVWTLASLPGLRFMTSLVYSKETIAYTRVEGAVAFTIDDGFCGLDNPEGCMLEEVRALFKEHDARATFFVAGSHCEHTSAEDVAALLTDGHELANHNMRDHPYVSFTREEFAADLDETEAVLARYRTEAPAWYRAPFARMTKRMYEELDARGMKHILCDAFANDTTIPDPEWIARTVLSQCQPGSIALIHMPERGCREWNLEAMRLTLAGLKARDLEVITLSELFARA